MQKNRQNNLSIFSNVRALCTAALLAAVCVVISYICKSFTVTMSVRVTFENLPLILSGYILGPVAGLLTGFTADIVSTAATYGIGGINPILTVGAASVGFTAGILSHYAFRKRTLIHILATSFISHFVGNMLIKTVGLWFYYHTPPVEIITRIIIYICIALTEGLLLTTILRSKGIIKAIGAIYK